MEGTRRDRTYSLAPRGIQSRTTSPRVSSTTPVQPEVIIGDLIRKQLHELAGILFQDVIKLSPCTGISEIAEENVEHAFRLVDALDLYDPIPLSFLQSVAVERVCRESLAPAVFRQLFRMCNWIPIASESGNQYRRNQNRRPYCSPCPCQFANTPTHQISPLILVRSPHSRAHPIYGETTIPVIQFHHGDDPVVICTSFDHGPIPVALIAFTR